VRHVDVTTDDGVLGLNPGIEFKVLKDNGATFHVTDGREEADISKGLLTNDLYVARDAAAQDAALLSVINQLGSQQAKAADEANAAYDAATIKAPRDVLIIQVPRAAPNPLDRGAYNEHTGVSRSPWIY